MRYEITGTPMPVVTCYLAAGETMKTQKGAMSWMTPNMEMHTNAGGGIGKAFSRALSGESIFQNTYTAIGSEGMIAFASSFPGEVLPVQITPGNSIIAQKTSFIASEAGVDFSIHFRKKFGVGLFGGEGFIMQKFSGNGMVFLEIDGCLNSYTLQAGQSLILDTGYLVAMDESVKMDIQTVKGAGNVLFGGEGLFNTVVTGPGRIWIQTMPISRMAGAINPYIIKSGN